MSDTPTYMHNVRKLQGAVKELTEMTEPDVDRILPIVEEGIEAYRQIRARIDLVREGLAKARQSLSS